MSRPLTGDEPLDQRTQIMMAKSELVAIDDWRFARRIGSRSEAIRQLIELGLAAAKAGWRPEKEPEGEEKP